MSSTERRKWIRELTLANGVICRTTLPDGSVVTGRISNCSDGGVMVSGETVGVRPNESVGLLFVFPSGEQVRYEATVQHVNVERGFFGARFDSDPIPVEVHRPDL